MLDSQGRHLNIEEIQKYIPHRYPFLLIDKVLDWQKDDYIQVRKCVTYNEHFFQGHFPEYKVVPGVLLIEVVAQAAALLAALGEGPQGKGGMDVRFVRVTDARFQREVRPGDVLEVFVREVKRRGDFRWGDGLIKVDERVVMKVSLIALVTFPSEGDKD